MTTSMAIPSALRRIAAPHRVVPGFILALLILLLAGYVTLESIHELVQSGRQVARAHAQVERVQALRGDLRAVAATARAFALTGSAALIEASRADRAALQGRVADLRTALDDDQRAQLQVDEFERALAAAEGLFADAAAVSASAGAVAGRARLEFEDSRQVLAELEASGAGLEETRRAALRERNARYDEVSDRTLRNVSGASVAALSLLLIAGLIVRRDTRERLRAAAEVAAANERLAASATAAQARTVQIARLAHLSQLLQACQHSSEAYRVIERMLPALVERPGGLYMLSPEANVLELVAGWGELPPYERVFSADDCWALRRSRQHESERDGSGPACAHLGTDGEATCIPIVARDMLGVLVLAGPSMATDGVTPSDQEQIVMATAEQVSLALANLRLRDTLKTQSIRDPLTGLFNRRFLEEALDRECRRALRADRPLSLVVFDVDYFKRFNDDFGHEAGDLVLKELGSLLQGMFREEDVACRFGGEEFALVLADTTLEQAIQRAEELRVGARQIVITDGERNVGSITLSLGVATLPRHGTTGDVLLRAADKALYVAKNGGRDRVSVAEPIPVKADRPALRRIV